MRTHTAVWRLQRRLAHIQGLRLPVQWTLTTIGIWLTTQLAWGLLLAALTNGPSVGTAAYWLVPPLVVAGATDRLTVDGRPILHATVARLAWAIQPTRWHNLTPTRPSRPHHVRASVLQAHGDRL